MRVTAEALAHHGLYIERKLEALVNRFAAEEFGAGGGGLPVFAQRMVSAADHSTTVREMVVVGPDKTVIERFGPGDETHPCLAALPVGLRAVHEHGAGKLDPSPVGCLVLPVEVSGRLAASVYLHVTRDWAEGGTLVQSAVRRTALQLTSVFAGFYVLLGVLLITATRAAERWRRKAEQAERVEALGALASGINHEIKNPLNALALCLQVMERRHRDAESVETLDMAEQQAKQIAATLDEFARFVRVTDLKLQEADVGARIRERAERRDWPVEVRGNVAAKIDTKKMDEALDTILDLLASGSEPVQLKLRGGARQWTLIARADDAGFDQASVGHLFDPYVRTRPRDVGRGLAWAKAVFQAHGGDVTATVSNGTLEVRAHATNEPGE
ncbi:MAG: histidine kinase dimerization/phospho-acceptor domain-containing protein [Planctomycetota bacterium]|jgi:hypothetical protein